jgi:hypothetical protein
MTLIIKNANPSNLSKTAKAIEQYNIAIGSKKERLTIEWQTRNAAIIYSEGEKDKRTINVK